MAKNKKKKCKPENKCPICGTACTQSNLTDWCVIDYEGKKRRLCKRHPGVIREFEKQWGRKL